MFYFTDPNYPHPRATESAINPKVRATESAHTSNASYFRAKTNIIASVELLLSVALPVLLSNVLG